MRKSIDLVVLLFLWLAVKGRGREFLIQTGALQTPKLESVSRLQRGSRSLKVPRTVGYMPRVPSAYRLYSSPARATCHCHPPLISSRPLTRD
jgi:hypothetical protein